MTAEPPTVPSAAVALVGAGPGDVDLLTLDAEAALASARAVVADRSLAPLLAALAAEWRDRSDDVPSGAFAHQVLADGLAAVELVEDDRAASGELLDAVGRGPGVVRLYRGDPWAHPAGDGERGALAAAGIEWSTVPGVLDELAVLADAGIPVQVRTLAVTTTFVVDDGSGLTVPADAAHTLVIRTAELAATLGRLSSAMRQDGIDGRRSVAIVPEAGAACAVVRMTAAGLGEDGLPQGPGVVVVGLVAAVDLRPAGARAELVVGR